MATYTKTFLSGSTSGAPIAVASSSDPGTTIHTAVSGSTAFDEVWLWATNVSTTDAILTIVNGTSSTTQNRLVASVTATNIQLVLPGIPYNGALRISAFATSVSNVNCFGFVNRIQ